MKKEPKYYEVLLYLYNQKQEGKRYTHYYLLRKIIFDEETVKKYNHARRHKIVIDTMVCGYMGKLCRKNLCLVCYEYGTFSGYRITQKGIDLLKEKNKILTKH